MHSLSLPTAWESTAVQYVQFMIASGELFILTVYSAACLFGDQFIRHPTFWLLECSVWNVSRLPPIVLPICRFAPSTGLTDLTFYCHTLIVSLNIAVNWIYTYWVSECHNLFLTSSFLRLFLSICSCFINAFPVPDSTAQHSKQTQWVISLMSIVAISSFLHLSTCMIWFWFTLFILTFWLFF